MVIVIVTSIESFRPFYIEKFCSFCNLLTAADQVEYGKVTIIALSIRKMILLYYNDIVHETAHALF